MRTVLALLAITSIVTTAGVVLDICGVPRAAACAAMIGGAFYLAAISGLWRMAK